MEPLLPGRGTAFLWEKLSSFIVKDAVPGDGVIVLLIAGACQRPTPNTATYLKGMEEGMVTQIKCEPTPAMWSGYMMICNFVGPSQNSKSQQWYHFVPCTEDFLGTVSIPPLFLNDSGRQAYLLELKKEANSAPRVLLSFNTAQLAQLNTAKVNASTTLFEGRFKDGTLSFQVERHLGGRWTAFRIILGEEDIKDADWAIDPKEINWSRGSWCTVL